MVLNRYMAQLGVTNVTPEILKQISEVVVDHLGASGNLKNARERNSASHPIRERHLESDEELTDNQVKVLPVPLSKSGNEFFIGKDNIVSVEVLHK